VPRAWSDLRRRGERGKNRCGRQQLCDGPPTTAATTTSYRQHRHRVVRGGRSRKDRREDRVRNRSTGHADQSRRPFADA